MKAEPFACRRPPDGTFAAPGSHCTPHIRPQLRLAPGTKKRAQNRDALSHAHRIVAGRLRGKDIGLGGRFLDRHGVWFGRIRLGSSAGTFGRWLRGHNSLLSSHDGFAHYSAGFARSNAIRCGRVSGHGHCSHRQSAALPINTLMSIRFHHAGFSPVSIKRAFHCFIRSITIILDRCFFHNEQDSIRCRDAFSILQTARRSTSMELFVSTRINSSNWTNDGGYHGFW